MTKSNARLSTIILASLTSLTVLTPTVIAQQSTRRIQTPAPYNACNVRDGAGINFTTIGTFPDGTVVTLTGEQVRGWYSVQIGTTIGWMARQCLGL